ncbi:SDR family oxidoreductase [Pseudohoeflea coraliihabitans]|uniref:SDR family oxidoreductase n=1 Tax=Pseudohoeflea coraliihabitans TaxID=2860393 RepID=A0ABS6WJ97_9HYPH|nr:SDR family oxidoreductase [Pseudohoeflea sp. DP4N28-3]MBW3096023.1 SDR family oxidoreductase [Pseudohoeflea sp. DP4N28-3]
MKNTLPSGNHDDRSAGSHGSSAPTQRDRRRCTRALTYGRAAARPEEIASAILFLAADATFVNGQTLVIDGGS